MSLMQALATTSLKWRVECKCTPLAACPERTAKSLVLTVETEPGAEPISMAFRPSSSVTVEQMLAAFCREHLPQHPAYLEWRKDRGHAPVQLAIKAEDLQGIGEPMHTGLRKLAASPQSTITWNALYMVHPGDRVALWKAAIDVVSTAFAEGNTPTRHALATTLKKRLIETAETRDYLRPQDIGETVRQPEQAFALRVLLAGMKLTEHDEWMWAWLGYIVEDIK